jgi:hypothetical protein
VTHGIAAGALLAFLCSRTSAFLSIAAVSDEERFLISATSWSRSVADASASRIGFEGLETTFEPPRLAML